MFTTFAYNYTIWLTAATLVLHGQILSVVAIAQHVMEQRKIASGRLCYMYVL